MSAESTTRRTEANGPKILHLRCGDTVYKICLSEKMKQPRQVKGCRSEAGASKGLSKRKPTNRSGGTVMRFTLKDGKAIKCEMVR